MGRRDKKEIFKKQTWKWICQFVPEVSASRWKERFEFQIKCIIEQRTFLNGKGDKRALEKEKPIVGPICDPSSYLNFYTKYLYFKMLFVGITFHESVWPDLAKFRNFGKILNTWADLSLVYFLGRSWTWFSGKRACLLLQQSIFKTRWTLQLFLKMGHSRPLLFIFVFSTFHNSNLYW